jgi:hypothetical protein
MHETPKDAMINEIYRYEEDWFDIGNYACTCTCTLPKHLQFDVKSPENRIELISYSLISWLRKLKV